MIGPLGEGRDGTGVNFCHPPPLLVSREGAATRSLLPPGRGAEFQVELPVLRPAGPGERSVKLRGCGLFPCPAERTVLLAEPFCAGWPPKRRHPGFETLLPDPARLPGC